MGGSAGDGRTPNGRSRQRGDVTRARARETHLGSGSDSSCSFPGSRSAGSGPVGAGFAEPPSLSAGALGAGRLSGGRGGGGGGLEGGGGWSGRRSGGAARLLSSPTWSAAEAVCSPAPARSELGWETPVLGRGGLGLRAPLEPEEG